MNNKLSWMTIILTVIIIAAAPVLGATFSRDMPAKVDPASEFTAKLNIPDAVAGESLTIEETLPSGVVLKSWDIIGTKESKTALLGDAKKYRVKDGAYAWSVIPTGPVTITYTATSPSNEGNLDFNAVWFDKSGFNKNSFTLSVATAAAAPATEQPPAPVASPTPVPTPAATAQKPAAQTPKPASQSTSGAGTWAVILGLIIVIAGITWYYYSNKKKRF